MTQRIEAPDGTIIEFPDGMSTPDIEAVMRREFGAPETSSTEAPQAPRDDVRGGALAASTTGALQGLTLGFGDELMAGLMTPIEMGVSAVRGTDAGQGLGERAGSAYNRLLDRERAQLETSRQDAPAATVAGELAGGLISGGGLGKAGITAMRPGLGAGGRIAAGAVEGAAYGGAYGIGTAEGGAGHRLSGAQSGAAMGAAVGGAIPAIGMTMGAATKPVRDAVSARMNPEAYAQRKVTERLSANGMTPDQAANRIADAQTRGSSLSLVDTAGKSARSLLRTTTNIPGPAQDRVATQLSLRAMGQGDRLRSAVKDTLAHPDGYLTAKQKLRDEMSALAGPAYAEAYKVNVPMPKDIQAVFETPAGKSALRKAIELAQNEGVDLKGPNTKVLAYVKRAMDDMIDAQTDSITKKMSNEGRILAGLKNRLNDHLKKWNPKFREASENWASGSQIDEAMELGRDVLKLSSETVRRKVAGFSKAEKEAVRIGAADALRQKIDSAGFTQNALLRFFANRNNIGSLQAVFPDERSFGTFRKIMFDEARKRATYDAVKGNSTTARQLADLGESGQLAETVSTVGTAATAGPLAAGLQFLATRLKMLGGMTPEVADNIAKILMERDPAAVQQITQQLNQIAQSQLSATQRSQAVSQMLSRVLPMPAAMAVGQ